ncbi:MAG TPA: hypothetical protein RMH99_33120 [Sandaracinaceae bacterium LLY-WYZ-13_1]|nr:hypothetical protein [Sandaracinaceae bacterium LLY-WYZ-13_1]
MLQRRLILLPAGLLLVALAGCEPEGPYGGEDGGGVPTECTSYEYRGEVYDCSALDRCTETDLEYRLACCDCDPSLCNPDPSCDGGMPLPTDPAESCMSCHNGSEYNDYAGEGMSNPHPFPGEPNIACTTCHGGNGEGTGKLGSHVPPPPEIGDDANLIADPVAYHNRRTLSGIDQFPDYTVDGVTYTALEYLQFINPGDLRVVTEGNGCGTPGCHAGEHADWVPNNVIATAAGMFSGAAYTTGVDNHIPEHEGLWQDTAAEYGFRERTDDDWAGRGDRQGTVGRVDQLPERAQYGDGVIYDNPVYNSDNFNDYVTAAGDPEGANRIIAGTPLEHTFLEAVGITCGDCHLGSAGANDRYGDFRSSGCTACHMEYSPDGRSRSTDPNVDHNEPANPDEIAAPERSHIDSHQIRNVAKTLPSGAFVRGISDYACAGCHQGSNRTVMQYWGIRLDQNADVADNNQYPANPQNFQNTAADDRLFDPAVGNNTFNGREADQYLLTEDYDGDGRDDTPADVHHEAGMGCIDCHGSRDLHNGTAGDDTSGSIISRMDQGTHIECQSCHGGVSNYAATVPCTTYAGEEAECATDRLGNALRHVTVDVEGNTWLVSRLNGDRHYVPQTRDVVVQSSRTNPDTGRLVWTPLGSYAMGRNDGRMDTGLGPIQTDPDISRTPNFSHTDRMDCASCHSSWTNNCIGCHLANGYDDNPAEFFFSNITGDRIVNFQAAADFTYITPVPFYLGVNGRGRITQLQPGIQMFYRYFDFNETESDVFAFSDRQGNGNNPDVVGRDPHPALSVDAMMPHSIRGRVTADAEGPRYCVACHLTTDAIDNFGAQYDDFRANLANRNYGRLDFPLLQEHIGQNTGNQLNSPFWVHMVAGLGSGLFLFDDTGCPENPLDADDDRHYCPDGAPADNFDPNAVVYNLDGLVEPTGVSNSSSSHPSQDATRSSALRIGSTNPTMSGPLGAELVQMLADPDVGVVLDSWLDADGQAQGDAAEYLP